MASKRRQLAALVDRAGLSRALLGVRKRALFPWRWLTVLTYHRVGETVSPGYDPDVLDATPATFERHVKLLQRYFTLVDTRDLDTWRAGGSLPANPAMITFDDGYRDNHATVMPILKRLGAKAVFFVATSYITERRVFWWELVNHALLGSSKPSLTLNYPQAIELPLGETAQRMTSIRRLLKLLKQVEGVDMERFLAELFTAAGLPFSREREREIANAMLMTWDEIRGLKDAGFDVQSHSHAHRVLHTLTPEAAKQDLLLARQQLEGALNGPVTSVAYPTGRPIGDSAPLRQAVLDAGYRYGFTVQPLVPLDRMSDWLGIPRMMIDRQVDESFFRTTLAVPALAY